MQRLDRLVSDLLVFSRTTPRAPQTHDVAELTAARASLLTSWAAQRLVSVRASGAGRARIDGDAVVRAIDNLLRNAIEASPIGATVELEVSSHDTTVEVRVSDRGMGVPEAHAAELFEPFFTTKPSGTGLGLALARAIARSHGGELTFHRAEGRTDFLMTLPNGE